MKVSFVSLDNVESSSSEKRHKRVGDLKMLVENVGALLSIIMKCGKLHCLNL